MVTQTTVFLESHVFQHIQYGNDHILVIYSRHLWRCSNINLPPVQKKGERVRKRVKQRMNKCRMCYDIATISWPKNLLFIILTQATILAHHWTNVESLQIQTVSHFRVDRFFQDENYVHRLLDD